MRDCRIEFAGYGSHHASVNRENREAQEAVESLLSKAEKLKELDISCNRLEAHGELGFRVY